ncbi:VOC family protein [Streptomyces sp. NPDC059786]|uniref:VOC family protein n=1 Tax=Streptomyces sp. NPDC059786 TaxID=3346946 RepID=UPI00364701B4
MQPSPRFTLSATTLDAPDARELARFYQDLLGWQVREEEPDWVAIGPAGAGAGLSFQSEPAFTRPVWPSTPHGQQMMMHLDIEVDEPAPAVERAVALGAAVADLQPQDDVRVLLDPVGHPFCLWTRARGHA